MKNILQVLLVFIFFLDNINSQYVTGKLVDENGIGLGEVQLELYSPTNIYYTASSLDGSFSFNLTTEVEDNLLPLGYSVSDNFPNPFNPRTRIAIVLPKSENVKVEVFNMLGQSVKGIIEHSYDAGISYIDIELNGLPSGFYISKITIDNKYTVVKKLMLIYGSQHLTTNISSFNTQIDKSHKIELDVVLDSLVAVSPIIGRETFTDLPVFTSGILDLGISIIERYCPGIPTVTYGDKTYHTIQIGPQCWLKENLDVGIMILSSQTATSNGIIEKYCYNDDPVNCDNYGGLYEWDETMQYVLDQGAQGICPPGWHIPTYADFQILIATVSNNANTLKEIGEGTDAGAGTNTSGFSALLSGILYRDNLQFFGLGRYAYFWTSTGDPDLAADNFILSSTTSTISNYISYKVNGHCVRCIKD
jgi:uncharacterized protein (TIGR02145 family)